MTLRAAYAAGVVKDGGLIAYPTEGVWGLGCDPLNADAVFQLARLKRRSLNKGFILLTRDVAQLTPFLATIPDEALQPALNSWPGAVTWILPASPTCPAWLSGGRNTFAARVSNHPAVIDICQYLPHGIVSTSANFSGRKVCRSASEVRMQFGNSVDAIVNGTTGELKSATPIYDLMTNKTVRETA